MHLTFQLHEQVVEYQLLLFTLPFDTESNSFFQTSILEPLLKSKRHQVTHVSNLQLLLDEPEQVHHASNETTFAVMRHYKVYRVPQLVLVDGHDNLLTRPSEILSFLNDTAFEKEEIELSALAQHVLQQLVQGTFINLVQSKAISFAPTSLEDHTQDTDAADAALQSRRVALEQYESQNVLTALKLLLIHLQTYPDDTIANYNVGSILIMLDFPLLAIAYVLVVVTATPNDASAHSILTSILYQAEPAGVIHGYKTLLSGKNNDFLIRHCRASHALASLEDHPSLSKANLTYVSQVFDAMADTFDATLVSHLHYQVPTVMGQLLVDLLNIPNPDSTPLDPSAETRQRSSSPRMLDLGCGTGLCGKVFKPFMSHMTGVDISPRMCDNCESLGIYDEVRVADLVPCLELWENSSLELITAADVWIYVGELSSVFKAAAAALSPGGFFCFSIESAESVVITGATGVIKHDDVGFKLVRSGRFQHTEAYIDSLVSHYEFNTLRQKHVVIRMESHEPIHGVVYVLQKMPNEQH